MRVSKLKIFSNPGYFVGKRVLALVGVFCVLVFFSLVYASGPNNFNTPPAGEHPWDELKSQTDHQPPKPPAITDLLILPCGTFGGWIIVHSPQVRSVDMGKDRVQVHPSNKNRGQ